MTSKEKLCANDAVCSRFVGAHGSDMAASLSAGESPDQFCASIGLCTYNSSCIVRSAAPCYYRCCGCRLLDVATCPITGVAFVPFLCALQLFKTWPVTPQGPWPSPVPYPSSYPKSAGEVSNADAVLAAPPTAFTQRMSQLVVLLSRLDAIADSFDVEADEDVLRQTHTGFYAFTKIFMSLMLAGAQPATVGDFPDPCGLNLTCIIKRVFDNHLPLLGKACLGGCCVCSGGLHARETLLTGGCVLCVAAVQTRTRTTSRLVAPTVS